METLPQAQIQPEHLEVVNLYLQLHSQAKVAHELNIPLELVQYILNLPHCKRYIDSVFLELGFNNRFQLREAMDLIIQKKFEELDQADLGSNKDIADLLLQSHKMSMDLLDREIKLKQLELDIENKQRIQNQVNVQINDAVGSNYQQLLNKLLGDNLGA